MEKDHLDLTRMKDALEIEKSKSKKEREALTQERRALKDEVDKLVLMRKELLSREKNN